MTITESVLISTPLTSLERLTAEIMLRSCNSETISSVDSQMGYPFSTLLCSHSAFERRTFTEKPPIEEITRRSDFCWGFAGVTKRSPLAPILGREFGNSESRHFRNSRRMAMDRFPKISPLGNDTITGRARGDGFSGGGDGTEREGREDCVMGLRRLGALGGNSVCKLVGEDIIDGH